MYRLVAYGLSLLAAVSFIFSLGEMLSERVGDLAISLVVLLASCYAANKTLSKLWRVPTNNESWFITALILFFILPPSSTVEREGLIALAGVIAMASKFIIARGRKHIFNPAAFAAGLLGTLGFLHASWWVSSDVLWPFTLVLGLLVIRKLRRSYIFIWFASASFVIALILGLPQGQGLGEILRLAITSSQLIFLGTIMLTEPATMPSRRNHQIIFAVLVAALFSFHWQIAGFYIYPEIALLLGNIYAFVVSSQSRQRLRLKEIKPISERVSDYVFIPEKKLNFIPGQYLEWTLPHNKQDSRGNRRTFTIASSPTEKDIHLGVKFYEPSSSFKHELRTMKPGDSIYAGQLGGNFTLPSETKSKLVFIAGGIGITPFRSMVKYIIDTNQQRDVVVLYLLSNPEDAAYVEILKRAESHGVKTIEILPGDKPLGSDTIRKYVTDLEQRTYFISGPNGMVGNTRNMLLQMHVPRRQIKTDYFSGY
jgi:ferredoxin-NADP reductase